METRSKVSGGSETLKKSNRGGQTAVRTPKITNVPACKAQGNQHEIRIALFVCETEISSRVYNLNIPHIALRVKKINLAFLSKVLIDTN